MASLTASAGCGEVASDLQAADAEGPVEAGGVRVSASLQGSSVVRVHFEPLRPGFHIYSLTLPAGGVDGLGVPTRVEAGSGFTASGPARSTVEPISLRIPELSVTLPVYPDGPVDIELPVDVDHSDDNTVIVAYGACSDEVCLLPVRDLVVPVD
ncbi:MAG TPA: hypothetical protein VNS46_13520 [Nocardioides sp.]|nr:hypothetical protein [Nocardioides sp.]